MDTLALSVCIVGLGVLVPALRSSGRVQMWPSFEFARESRDLGWHADHDIAELTATPEGLRIAISGEDPYLSGPVVALPGKEAVWLRIRLRSTTGGGGQVFYAGPTEGASQDRAVSFAVKAGVWDEVRVPLPALGPAARLRLDPPGSSGTCTVAFIRFEPRTVFSWPAIPKPAPPELGVNPLVLWSGDASLVHSRTKLNVWQLQVDGKSTACGFPGALVGYLHEGQPRWFVLPRTARVRKTKAGFTVGAMGNDPDGAVWSIRQRFTVGKLKGTFGVECLVSVSADRQVVFLPLFLTLPGLGSFGRDKGHAVFPGLEFLDRNEPSSSQADITSRGWNRQVPDSAKITIPMTAIQAGHRYAALFWDPSPSIAAVFDSPDRIFGSAGHLMGLICPGSNPDNRPDASILPEDGYLIKANHAVVAHVTLAAGRGENVVPALRQWTALRGSGKPILPESPQGYLRFAADGWLSSKIHEGALYRHAYWPGVSSFAPSPSSEAALLMSFIADRIDDPERAARLREAASASLAAVPAERFDTATVSHMPTPAAALVFGHVPEAMEAARSRARQALRRFEPDGSVHYRMEAGRPDYGKTHFAPSANGLTAQVLLGLLKDASFCGDHELISAGLKKLDALMKDHDGTPRGAQTWEVPLHTPDILAAALLVKCFVLGYELTGKAAYLKEADAWAWKGLPFVYLVKPTDGPVGLYATIAVYGATNWTAPNWMGLPVQWCGLVFADALYDLSPWTAGDHWRRLADGIVASGIQQSFASNEPDLQGLLPDSFNLRAQSRNGVAINPGTVQIPAVRSFGQIPVYGFRAFPKSGVSIHVPGRVYSLSERPGVLAFTVDAWPSKPYGVSLAGLASPASVKFNGKELVGSSDCRLLEPSGVLLTLSGGGRIVVKLGL